jgi:hypothetical protein
MMRSRSTSCPRSASVCASKPHSGQGTRMIKTRAHPGPLASTPQGAASGFAVVIDDSPVGSGCKQSFRQSVHRARPSRRCENTPGHPFAAGSRPWPLLLDGGIEVVSHGGAVCAFPSRARARAGKPSRALALIPRKLHAVRSPRFR